MTLQSGIWPVRAPQNWHGIGRRAGFHRPITDPCGGSTDPPQTPHRHILAQEITSNCLSTQLLCKFVSQLDLSPNFSLTARPYESCKIFKVRPCRNAFSKLVHRQYKSFAPDRFCQVEIPNTTGLSNRPHNLVRRIRFWRIKSPEQDFKYCTERSVK